MLLVCACSLCCDGAVVVAGVVVLALGLVYRWLAGMTSAKDKVRALCAAPGTKGPAAISGVRAPRAEAPCVQEVAAALQDALVDCRVRVALFVPGASQHPCSNGWFMCGMGWVVAQI